MTTPSFELATMDAVDFLTRLDDESVDCIVTDPAYESLEKHRAIGTTTRLQAWFQIFRNSRFPDLLREAQRVLVPNAHLYVMSDQETAFVIRPMIESLGLTWWKLIIWAKTKAGTEEPSAGMGYHYRAAHEVITFAEKGKRRLNDLGIPDVLPFPRVRTAWDGSGPAYPTEKPVGLSRVLIEQSTAPGELVVDPFLGSGSTGEAALLAGRNFAGCDVAPDAVRRAGLRLARHGTAGLVTRDRKQGELFG